ncbi:hypothetical protein B0H16DRAFT_831894 [Mycena metata]|uniref:Uncharacterized protein n=1 Tax=Mycena metata TaxID=1033252 RepID=A0AAD7IZ36_9AGAR|nr:hypothetical protein B0H16DRAFT_831894 [Mycena metata]
MYIDAVALPTSTMDRCTPQIRPHTPVFPYPRAAPISYRRIASPTGSCMYRRGRVSGLYNSTGVLQRVIPDTSVSSHTPAAAPVDRLFTEDPVRDLPRASSIADAGTSHPTMSSPTFRLLQDLRRCRIVHAVRRLRCTATTGAAEILFSVGVACRGICHCTIVVSHVFPGPRVSQCTPIEAIGHSLATAPNMQTLHNRCTPRQTSTPRFFLHFEVRLRRRHGSPNSKLRRDVISVEASRTIHFLPIARAFCLKPRLFGQSSFAPAVSVIASPHSPLLPFIGASGADVQVLQMQLREVGPSGAACSSSCYPPAPLPTAALAYTGREGDEGDFAGKGMSF